MKATAEARVEEGWSPERVDLIKRTLCGGKPISDDEFRVLIERCQRAGLDPLADQCVFTKRRQNIGTKERPNWIEKWNVQPTETGFLSRAEEFSDYRGTQAFAVYAGDHCKIVAAEGKVDHVASPPERQGALLGAWAKVDRKGRVSTVVWLDLSGYVQAQEMWRKIPATMIEKCARVGALRKAYPKTFGSLYIKEEMRTEEPEEQPQQGTAPAAVSAPAPVRLLSAAAGPAGTAPETPRAEIPVGRAASKRVELPRTQAAYSRREPAPKTQTRKTAIWEKAKGHGIDERGFPGWVKGVLKSDTSKKAAEWTDEDCERLEAALRRLEPPDELPAVKP